RPSRAGLAGRWRRAGRTRSGGDDEGGIPGPYAMWALIRSISSRTSRSAVADTVASTLSRTTWSDMRSITRRVTCSTISLVGTRAIEAEADPGHSAVPIASACSAGGIAAHAAASDGIPERADGDGGGIEAGTK